MQSEFRPVHPSERGLAIDFLKEAFSATGSEPGLQEAQMRWKYEDTAAPHAWSCRNVAIFRDGAMLAHAGVWPVRMRQTGGEYSGVHLIDWASIQPGAGVAILQKVSRSEGVIYGLGGSAMTRKIFPSLGFRPLASIGYYARPLRPWRQIRTHQHRGQWKTPLRWIRNAWWSRRPEPLAGQARMSDPESYTAWPAPLPGLAVVHRDGGGFRYLERCPVMRTRFYVLSGEGPAGYFLLATVPGQARIADAWVNTPQDPRSWEILFAQAEQAALAEPEAAEIVTIAGLPAAREALERRHFQRVKEEELMLYDPKRTLPPPGQVHFQLVDNDACYLHNGSPLYWT